MTPTAREWLDFGRALLAWAHESKLDVLQAALCGLVFVYGIWLGRQLGPRR